MTKQSLNKKSRSIKLGWVMVERQIVGITLSNENRIPKVQKFDIACSCWGMEVDGKPIYKSNRFPRVER